MLIRLLGSVLTRPGNQRRRRELYKSVPELRGTLSSSGSLHKKHRVFVRSNSRRSTARRYKGTHDYPQDSRGKHTKADRRRQINSAIKDGIKWVESTGKYSDSYCDDCGAAASAFTLSEDKSGYVCTECGTMAEARVYMDSFQSTKDIQRGVRQASTARAEWEYSCQNAGIGVTRAPINDCTGTTYHGKNYAAERIKMASNSEPEILPQHMETIRETYLQLAAEQQSNYNRAQGEEGEKKEYAKARPIVAKDYEDYVKRGPLIPPLSFFTKDHVIRLLGKCGITVTLNQKERSMVHVYAENWVQIICSLCWEIKPEILRVFGELLPHDRGQEMLEMYSPFYEIFVQKHKGHTPGTKNVPKLDVVFLYFLFLLGGKDEVKKYGRLFVGKRVGIDQKALYNTTKKVLQISESVSKINPPVYAGVFNRHQDRAAISNDKHLLQRFANKLTYYWPLSHMNAHFKCLNRYVKDGK